MRICIISTHAMGTVAGEGDTNNRLGGKENMKRKNGYKKGSEERMMEEK